MAIIKCSECGKEISSDSASCPYCGNPIASINEDDEEFLYCPSCHSRKLSISKNPFVSIKTFTKDFWNRSNSAENENVTCQKCKKQFKIEELGLHKACSNINEELLRLLKDKGKLASVKYFKRLTGVSLSEAIDYIENISKEYDLHTDKKIQILPIGKGCVVLLIIGCIIAIIWSLI